MVQKERDPQNDPKALIFESYRIEGITLEQCRSIFLDWALSLPVETDNQAAIAVLLARYGESAPEHPMTKVLSEGQAQMQAPRRRGGWRSRPRS